MTSAGNAAAAGSHGHGTRGGDEGEAEAEADEGAGGMTKAGPASSHGAHGGEHSHGPAPRRTCGANVRRSWATLKSSPSAARSAERRGRAGAAPDLRPLDKTQPTADAHDGEYGPEIYEGYAPFGPFLGGTFSAP